MSTKKILKDYEETKKLKKLKEKQQKSTHVEKILEWHKKKQKDTKSSLLPKIMQSTE